MGVLSLAFLLFISMGSCASTPAPAPVPAKLGSEVVLTRGASHHVADTDLTVVFETVVEDSRCPTGVSCVWAGDAAVRIRIEAPATASVTRELHTNAGFEREMAHGGVRVRLVSLTPEPGPDGPPRPDDYRATLSIEHK